MLDVLHLSKMNIEHRTFKIEWSTKERRRFWLALIGVALVAIVVLIMSTRWGLATSSDSARYVRTARGVYESREPSVDAEEPKHEQAHFPPFYPICLAIAGKLSSADPLASARWLHAV